MSDVTNKAVLFLVEGDTDELSLGEIIKKYLAPKKEFFQVIGTDITSAYDIKPDNIIDEINSQIHDKLDEIKLFESDVLAVIHLVDMDGAYVTKDFIKEMKPCSKWIYQDFAIIGDSIEKVVSRNKHKIENLNRLLVTKLVGKFYTIPYKVFYFSCNLEHVLHNNPNVDDRDKRDKAEEFADKYCDDVEGFVKFISQSDFSVAGSWQETWDFIKERNNSLKRYTNFGLFFKEGVMG
ncbi:hypothetical protein [Selenomonas ruminis]|uniref:DUF4276 family protein n=1 Tax=Selenomonas ruminis TaxID=2593411 RepID=A0A5D6W8H0_9FIRM|nr:hypothetical protein [Selenomonas sp. mPRGC5]TYZ24136.1 hypothetical protein FZ040_05315 [Selenomonas sp. mPRGC5]